MTDLKTVWRCVDHDGDVHWLSLGEVNSHGVQAFTEETLFIQSRLVRDALNRQLVLTDCGDLAQDPINDCIMSIMDELWGG